MPDDEPVNQFHVAAGRPDYGTLMSRALQLKCPRCGQGNLFRRWYSMHERCEKCGMKFDRGPGYYLGSMYINYGLTAVITTAVFLFGRLYLNVRGETLLPPLAVFTIVFPPLIFRHARAWWLAMDCHFDPEVLSDESNAPE
jgi:uncharacterized protein (DUF983 family)